MLLRITAVLLLAIALQMVLFGGSVLAAPQGCHDQPIEGKAPDRVDLGEVEITIAPSRDNLAAGDLWAVTGVIQNRSKDKAIYIVDKKTALMFAPEVYGTSTGTFALIADFSTVFYDPPGFPYKATWVCIEPGGNYAVTWRFNSPSNTSQYQSCIKSGTATATDPPLVPVIYEASPWSVLRNYTFFSPGIFRATATTHIFYEVPKILNETCQVFLDNSFPVTVTKDLPINAPLLVLIVGAALGGFVCRILQMATGDANDLRAIASGTVSWQKYATYVLAGLVAAVLLPGVATILLARMSTSEFPIAVKVNDIWGAFAVGLVVQFFGYSWFRRRVLGQVGVPPEVSNLTFAPSRVRLSDQAPSRVRVSARGLTNDARVDAVSLVDLDGKPAAVLTPTGAPPMVINNGFTDAEYLVPMTVQPGTYSLVLTLSTGAAAKSSETLSVEQ